MTPAPPREEIRNELLRAERSLQAAHLLLKERLLEDALSRAYYAILHAARGALLAQGVNVASHRAVRRLFGQHLGLSAEGRVTLVSRDFGGSA